MKLKTQSGLASEVEVTVEAGERVRTERWIGKFGLFIKYLPAHLIWSLMFLKTYA